MVLITKTSKGSGVAAIKVLLPITLLHPLFMISHYNPCEVKSPGEPGNKYLKMEGHGGGEKPAYQSILSFSQLCRIHHRSLKGYILLVTARNRSESPAIRAMAPMA